MRRLAPTLMVQGTASGVGKSWLVTGLCRALARRGLDVAPFKAQNMSNNAAVTPAGGEIGRAQAVQALAAGKEPDERFNPVLVKPIDDRRADVVVLGSSRSDLAGIPWRERRGRLWPYVTGALDSLRAEVDWVVAEGAGSPAEVNLRKGDIVNMAVAHHAGARVLLVADVDRGGAFAAALGTWALLDPADRRPLHGFVLNRFRGDPRLLGEAPAELTRRTGVPVLGIVPWLPVPLPEEDAAAVERAPAGSEGQVAVLRLPRMANFDDVLPLAGDPQVGVRWVDRPGDLAGARAVVLPGTRNSAGDLAWMRGHGLDRALLDVARSGTLVLGLCGGLQILGRAIADPGGVEEGGSVPALGLLDVGTVLEPRKRRGRIRARWQAGGASGLLDGYEIHHGATAAGGVASPFMWDHLDPGRILGYRKGTVWGTYVHGCLADDAFRRAWLAGAGLECGPRSPSLPEAIEAVADAAEAALDVDALLEAAVRR